MWMPTLIYFVWMILHALFFQVIAKGWLSRKKKQVLYHYIEESDPSMKAIWKYTDKCNIPRPIAYYLTHFALNFFLSLLSFIFWQSFVIHTAWMVLLLSSAVYNGGTYTFKVLLLRYAPEKLKKFGFESISFEKDEVRKDQ